MDPRSANLKLLDIVQAHRRIKPYVSWAPLVYSEVLSEQTGAKIWLKLECLQPTGSFKVRGAVHKLAVLEKDARLRRVVTASAGNHGLGVAFAAQALGLEEVTIFIPETTPKAKVDKLRRFPITLQQVGPTYADAHQAALEAAAAPETSYIPAYDDPQVIAGAGTCGLEILIDLPEVEVIIVPIGGGGLVAGIAVSAKGIQPGCRVIGVQPEASPAARLSFERNLPIDPYDHEPTIADGLAGGFGAYPFYIARALIDDILLHSENELRQAIYTLIDKEQLVVEASGAIAIAPLLRERHLFEGKVVACVLTGSNIDTKLLANILNNP